MKALRLLWTRWFRIGFAVLALVAIAIQLPRSIAAQGSLVNVLSYFTYEANLYAAAVLLWTALKPAASPAPVGRDLVRGAAVTYLAITGLVYLALLSGKPSSASIPWVNFTLHVVMPLAMLADWLIDPPGPAVTIRKALVWLAFPVLWLVYTFVRGGLTGWYPYPFLDPTLANNSWLSVLAFSAGILLLFLAVGALIAWLGRVLFRLEFRPLAHPGPTAPSAPA